MEKCKYMKDVGFYGVYECSHPTHECIGLCLCGDLEDCEAYEPEDLTED